MSQPPPQLTGKSLFSLHYLATRLPDHPEWAADPQATFAAVRTLWLHAQAYSATWNEAQTEDEFVKPVLELLGWSFIVQAKSVKKGRINRPDYALFADDAAKHAAYPQQGNEVVAALSPFAFSSASALRAFRQRANVLQPLDECRPHDSAAVCCWSRYTIDRRITICYTFVMSDTRWTTSNKAVYNIGYHLIWCPKYRRKVLVGAVAERLQELLIEKAQSIDCTIDVMEVMPDHVHVFIKSSPVHAPHYIVQQLKGYTSHALRKEFPSLKTRLPTLWTRSYTCESVGHIAQETVRKYIEEQKSK